MCFIHSWTRIKIVSFSYWAGPILSALYNLPLKYPCPDLPFIFKFNFSLFYPSVGHQRGTENLFSSKLNLPKCLRLVFHPKEYRFKVQVVKKNACKKCALLSTLTH